MAYDPSFLAALSSARDRLAELNTPLPERSPRRPVGPFETTTETIEKPFSFRDFLPSLPPASEPSGPLGMEGFPGLDQPDIAPPAPGAFDAASPPMPEPSPVRMPALPSAPGVSVVGAFDPGGIPEPAAAPEPPKQTPRGLLGESFGILTPEASKEAVAEKKRAALQRIAESEKAIADTEAFVAANPDLIKPSAFGTSQFANYDDIIKGRKEIIEEERRKLADIKGMERGEIAPPTKTKLRAAVESAPQSLISMGVALPVHYAGIVGGYVKQGIEAGLGTQIDAPDDNMVYRLGTQIDDFAKTVFPGDPARADEFGQKLAHGVGSLAAFYGSAGISVVTRLGPKAFHAIATKAPFIHGAAVAGASSFNEATEKMKEGKPVTEVDRLMGTIGQSVVGMSEALPVLSTLKAAKGAGSLRKAGTAATEGAIEEGAQELGQSIASDIAAQQTYDPERAIGETAGEEGVIGAILGAGAKVTGSAIGSAREKLARKANKPETDPDISAGTAENSSAAAAQTGNASAAAADEDIFEELPDEDVATPAKPAKAETASDLDEVAELLGAPTRVRNRVAQIEEPSSDRSGAATKLFGDAFNAEALATKGFDGLDRERQHMVLSHVRAALNDDKIFRAVVESVPVDVMNVLVGSKGPAKDLFHDKPVLTHRLSVPSDISIPQPIGRFIDSLATKIESASARLTAKEPGLRSEPSSVELPNDGRTALQASGRDVWHGTIGGEKVSVDINPSEKQKEAGNYLKGSVTPKTLGLKIAIETPKGTERRGVGEDGKPWTAVSQAHYGYIKGVEGKDGDAVDIYIGPELKSQQVTVVNQIDPKTGKLDEHKVLYGFADQAAAEAAYRGSFSDEVDRVGSIHTVPVAEFKEWLKSGNKTKEFAPKLLPGVPRFRRRTERPKATPSKSVLSFIREMGGIKPSGELRKLDAQRYPGIISRRGVSPDRAREALVEAGYIAERGADEVATSSPDNVYDLIDRAMRGERVVPAGELGADSDLAAHSKAYEFERELEASEETFLMPALASIPDAAMADLYGSFTDNEKAEVIDRFAFKNEDLSDIIEEVAMRGEDVPFALKRRPRKTKGQKSAKVPAKPAGGESEKSASDSTASRGKSGEAGADKSEAGGTARPGEGGEDTGAEGRYARILRSESAALRADGSVIAGRISRAPGRSVSGERHAGAVQEIGKTESFSIRGHAGFVTAVAPTSEEALDRIGASPAQYRIAELSYRIYPEGSKLQKSSQTPFKDLGEPIARVNISQHRDGAWEVSSVRVQEEARRQGVATKLYEAIERDLGIRMSPSGLLTKGGYAFWKKRSPESVKWHQWSAFDNFYVSPAWISNRIAAVGRDMADINRRPIIRPIDEIDLRAAQEERGRMIKLFAKLPPEARAAKDTMFALAGRRAANAPLGSLAAAERMEGRGKTPERIFKETGWFKGPDGFWRFEIDDSEASISEVAWSKFTAPNKPQPVVSRPEDRSIMRRLFGRKMADVIPSGPVRQVKTPDGKTMIINIPLPELLNHPRLYAAYPFLRQMRVDLKLSDSEKSGGWIAYGDHGGRVRYQPIRINSTSRAKAKSILLHELQHYIQSREGFAPGSPGIDDRNKHRVRAGTPGAVRRQTTFYNPNEGMIAGNQATMDYRYLRAMDSLSAPRSEAEGHALHLLELYERQNAEGWQGDEAKTQLTRAIQDEEERLERALRAGPDTYENSYGEWEARQVQSRAAMTAEQRRRSFPLAEMPPTLQSTSGLTSSYQQAYDEIMRRAQILRGMKEKWKEATPIGADISAVRISEDALVYVDTGQQPTSWVEAMQAALIHVDMYPTVAGAVIKHHSGFFGLPYARQKEVMDAIARDIRVRNVRPTVEGRQQPMAFEFWRRYDPTQLGGDPRLFREPLEKRIKEIYGQDAELVLYGDVNPDTGQEYEGAYEPFDVYVRQTGGSKDFLGALKAEIARITGQQAGLDEGPYDDATDRFDGALGREKMILEGLLEHIQGAPDPEAELRDAIVGMRAARDRAERRGDEIGYSEINDELMVAQELLESVSPQHVTAVPLAPIADILPQVSGFDAPQGVDRDLYYRVELDRALRKHGIRGDAMLALRGERGYDLTPEFEDQRAKVFADIEAEIARMAPDVKIRFKDLPPGVEGAFSQKLAAIFIAVRAADPRLIGDHEVIHAARAMNLITPEEWVTLMEAVEKHGWIAKHGVKEDYLQLARDRGLSEAEALDMLYEEAIAWEFAEWRKGRRPAATAWGRIFKRLADFIDRIAKALKLSKIEAFEQVFEMVERGPEARRRDLRQERQAQQNRADLTERILGRFPGVAVEDIEQAVAAAESRFAIRFRRQKGPDVEKIARDWATLIAEPIETAIGQYRVRRTASAGKGTAKYEIFYGDKLIGDAILTPPIERMKVPAEIVQIETMVERSRGVLGALGLRRRPDLSRFQRALPAGSVSRINLDEAYRRKGIGSALYAAMDADLRSVGAELFPSETHITKGGKALWLKYDPQRLLEFYDAEGLPKFHDDYLEAKVAVRDRARRDPGQDGNVAHFPRSGNKGRLAVIEKRIIRIYEDLNQAMEERYAIEEKGALTHADESRIAEIGAQIDSLEEERRTLAVERDELHEMLAAAQIDSGLFEQRDEAKEAERQLRYERHGIEKNIEELERKVAETPDDFQARRNLQLAKRRLNEVVGEEAEARSRLDKLNRELADIRFALSGRPKIDADIVNAYRRALDRNRPGNKWVYLKDLREGLPGYSREEIDTALKRLWVERTGGITAIDLSIQDDQGSLTEAQRAAATKFGASRQDMISIDSGSPLINLQASAKQRPLRMDDFDDDAAFALAGRRPRSSAVGRAYEEFFDGYAGLEPESRRYMRNRSRGYFERAAGAFGSQLQSTRITWQDGFLPVRRLQEAQERENKLALPEDMQPYLKEELYHSRLQTRIEEFEEHHVEPLKRAIAKSGLDLAQVELYLYARHAEERNRQIASINPKMPDGGSGMDTADAQQILSAIRRSSKRAEYERIAGFVDAINAAKLDARVDYGLMSQDDADTLRNAYQHYVPLKGDPQHDDERMPEPVNLPKGFSVTNKDMVRAMGRRSRAHDLIARSIQDYLETMVRGERNRVAQALYEMLRAYPMPEVAVIDTPKMKRFIDKRTGMQTALVANAPVQTAKQFKEMVREQADPLAFLDPNTMSVMVDGERHMIRFLVPELRDAMMNLGTPQGMGLIKAAWAFNRFIAMASTSLNPSFALPNFMRDFQAAGINLTADGHKKAFRRVLGNSVRAMKAITAVEAGRGKGQWADLYRDLKEVGGTTGFYSLTDWEGQQKQLEKDIRLLRAGLLNPAKQANAIFKGFKTVVGGFNNIFENATRLAAYKIALDEGLSQEKAASLAKNITVNFNRRGRLDTPAAKLVMAAYLFANPSIQGSHRLAKAMKDATPGRRYAILASLVGLGALTALYNVLIGAALGDDEEKNIYETTSDYDRANNWMFLNPFAERKEGISGRDAVALKIPMPYGYGAIVNWGRLAMEHAISEHTDLLKNKRSAGEVAGEMIAIMHGHFDPLGAHPSPLAAFAPTIAKPFVEMATNTKFHGGPVYPMQFDPSEPDTDLAWRTTPQIWKDLARSVNELGGGDDYHKGKLLGIETDFSPETFRHLGEFAIGGVGHEIARLFTMGERHYVTKEPIRLNDIPVIRRFVSDETGFGYSSDYYAVRDEQMKPYEDVRRDAGRGSEAAKAILPTLDLEKRLYPAYKRADKLLSVLRKDLKANDKARDDDKLTTEEWSKRQQDLYDRRQLTAMRFMVEYYAEGKLLDLEKDKSVPPQQRGKIAGQINRRRERARYNLSAIEQSIQGGTMHGKPPVADLSKIKNLAEKLRDGGGFLSPIEELID